MNRLRTWWICRKLGIKNKNYTYNKDGSIDVAQFSIEMSKKYSKFDKLPLKFNIVHGNFNCYGNNLSSFDGFPKIIYGDLNISHNNFKTLKGCPKVMGTENRMCKIICDNNNLLTFEGYVEGTNLSIKSNPINNIWNLFRDPKLIDLFNDYDAVRDNGEISFYRLNKFLEDNGFNTIERHQLRILKGYKLIENKEALNAYKQLLLLK